MIVYAVNSWILSISLVIAILLFMAVAIFKSNFMEITKVYKPVSGNDSIIIDKKNKEEKKQLYIRMSVIFGVLLILQGLGMIQFDNKIGYIIIILGAILIYIYFKYENKSNALINLNRFEEALICCDKYLNLNQKNEKMFYAKGFVFIKLGKIEEAKNCFYEALELNPNYEEAKKGKKFISSLKKNSSLYQIVLMNLNNQI